MLIQEDRPDEQATGYGYDALNRRIYKVDQDGEITSFLYDGVDVLQEVTGQNSQKIVGYYRANGKIVTRQEYNVSQGNNSKYQHRPQGRQLFYTYDALGSVATLTSHNSKLDQRNRYDAYGTLVQGEFNDNEYGFTGKRFAQESGT